MLNKSLFKKLHKLSERKKNPWQRPLSGNLLNKKIKNNLDAHLASGYKVLFYLSCFIQESVLSPVVYFTQYQFRPNCVIHTECQLRTKFQEVS